MYNIMKLYILVSKWYTVILIHDRPEMYFQMLNIPFLH